MISPKPWKLDDHDPSIIYDANGDVIAMDYKFLHVDDFESLCRTDKLDDIIERLERIEQTQYSGTRRG